MSQSPTILDRGEKRVRESGSTSARGIGWSWGIPGFLYGISSIGRRYISIGIPGTGLYFYKCFGTSDSSRLM
jgi:hypothetical protein